MSNILKSVEYKGYSIRIEPDDSAESPRTSCDNLGHMVCWHRRYSLGDKHEFKEPADFREFLNGQEGVIYLPRFLYDHSGITMSTGPFSCPWDSGQVGFIYATR